MDLSAIALPGLQQADAQLQAAAVRIASFGSASPGGAGLDTVDLNAEVVALMCAKNQSLASLITWKTADEMQKSVIDLMASTPTKLAAFRLSTKNVPRLLGPEVWQVNRPSGGNGRRRSPLCSNWAHAHLG